MYYHLNIIHNNVLRTVRRLPHCYLTVGLRQCCSCWTTGVNYYCITTACVTVKRFCWSRCLVVDIEITSLRRW